MTRTGSTPAHPYACPLIGNPPPSAGGVPTPIIVLRLRRPRVPAVPRDDSLQPRHPIGAPPLTQVSSSTWTSLIRLGTGRTTRRGGPRSRSAPRIGELRYIEDRLTEVEGRQVPGHWEGDLVIGKGGKSLVATLVERTSRFMVLVPLTRRDALTVGDAVIAAGREPPPQLARSLTWDCGAEMAGHGRITAAGLRCTSPDRTHPGNGAATRTSTESARALS